MTGRHRQTQAATRRALVATVPALGLVGAVGALAGTGPDAAPSAVADGAVAPAADVPAPLERAATAPPAVTTAAARASETADRAEQLQREQERRALAAVVSDVRADAQDREAAAAAQGQQELEAFRRDVAREQQPEPETRDEPTPTQTDRGSDGETDRCDTSGTPRFGDRVDADEIVGRDCGLVDVFGRDRSFDPWVDGQLLDALDR